MTKNQYQFDFERHRKEIPEKQHSGQLPSRAELQRKRKDDQHKRVKLINVLLAVFTLIPIIILLYVLSDSYSPSVPKQVPIEKNEVQVGALYDEALPMSTRLWISA